MTFLKYSRFATIRQCIFFTAILTILQVYSTSAQNVLGGLLNKAKVNINLPRINTNKQNSGIDGKSTYQPVNITSADTSKYYKVASNFYLNIGDIKKQYPNGYKPKWSPIGEFAQIQFNKTNYLQGKMRTTDARNIGIDEFNGKAYVYFGGFLSCNCAGLLVPNNDIVVINNIPQTFIVTDFWQITNDGKVTSNPCKNMTMSYYDTGGWKLKISLSINNDQTLLVNTIVQSLTSQSGYINRNGTNISNIWDSEDVTFPNLMPAEKAISTVKQIEQDIKDAAARKLARERKEEEERLAFEASIKNSLQKVAAQQRTYADYNLGCIKTATYNVYEPGSEKSTHMVTEATGTTDLNTGAPIYSRREVVDSYGSPGKNVSYTGSKNTCDKAITIKGITKQISPSGTIYYIDASLHLDAGEIYKEKIVISDYFNPKTAEINSTHYYKNNLVTTAAPIGAKKTIKKR